MNSDTSAEITVECNYHPNAGTDEQNHKGSNVLVCKQCEHILFRRLDA